MLLVTSSYTRNGLHVISDSTFNTKAKHLADIKFKTLSGWSKYLPSPRQTQSRICPGRWECRVANNGLFTHVKTSSAIT